MSRRIILLDTASLYFRAFYGVPDTVRDPRGEPINAARGLVDMIAKLALFSESTELVACWDDDWRPAWRVELVPSYKAHRVATAAPEAGSAGGAQEEVPDDLELQLPLIRRALDALGIPIIGAADAEADDVIGTLAARATHPVDIVTGDRDLFQLVDDAKQARVVYTAKGMSNLEVITDEVVRSRYGVSPDQYVDFATMRGDASDGLPGVAGIGDKTAARLLDVFGSLSGIRSAAASDPLPPGITANIAGRVRDASDYLDAAVRVVRVASDLELPALRFTAPDADAAHALAQEHGLGASMQRALDALTPAAHS